MLNYHFVLLGAAFNLAGSLGYVIDTLKSKTRPNRITWFLWAFAPIVAFSAELGKGVGLRSLMTFMVGFGPLMVVIASFVNRKSVWKLTRFDLICGVLSVVGLILWLITRQGNIAIALSIAADALASMPTVVKSFKDPESESYLVFLFGSISAAITLFTIKEWTFANYGFPVYIFFICIVLFLLIRFKFGVRLLSQKTLTG